MVRRFSLEMIILKRFVGLEKSRGESGWSGWVRWEEEELEMEIGRSSAPLSRFELLRFGLQFWIQALDWYWTQYRTRVIRNSSFQELIRSSFGLLWFSSFSRLFLEPHLMLLISVLLFLWMKSVCQMLTLRGFHEWKKDNDDLKES